jgi:DNA-binding response OmpR family regulator
MPEKKAVRQEILIVEDEPSVAKTLSDVLIAEGYNTQMADTLKAARAFLATTIPELVMLDLNLPDGDGLELAAFLRQSGNPAPCGLIMLTARGSKDDIVRGLELGADDYLTKPYHEREMLARVGALLRRKETKTGGVTRKARLLKHGIISLDPFSHEVWLDGEETKLTRREFEILKVFMQHPGQALSREAIIQEAWGGDLSIVQRVVDVHVGHLRRKLGEAAAKIETVPQVGFRFKKE